MQSFTNISVVVQGPVQNTATRTHHEEGITIKCLNSIRQFLPGATIILSTWQGQNISGLDVDKVLLNDDPGPDDERFLPLNYHRQLVSTRAGLAQVETRYALKLRSDNFLTGNQFVDLQQAFLKGQDEAKLFEQRVVVNANLSRRTSHGRRVIMSPSDFFYYGLTQDLKKIWQQPNFCQQSFATDYQQLRLQANEVNKLEAEQVYCQIWLKHLDPNAPLLANRFDKAKQYLSYWERFLANNLIIADPETMGLGLRRVSERKQKRANEYSHDDWLALYKTYCDEDFTIPFSLQQAWLTTRRLIKLPISGSYFKLRHPRSC
ncbi:WavE lipopolysaccharide synthesis family protein [Motilimonas pumila]|uniref:LPS biosynthesis protein WavE n=1 Tax=Motilimonas pumila TaxID=2303987 RepID=A0A418YHG8_9GAMM|nr:WavE lipopolysaccharide synthesis family protein [Motilimonas pumila]RJG49548.1 LPS biosynthesis protein WavE [Motilimonas pumila]